MTLLKPNFGVFFEKLTHQNARHGDLRDSRSKMT
jgi:hypothetical protein